MNDFMHIPKYRNPSHPSGASKDTSRKACHDALRHCRATNQACHGEHGKHGKHGKESSSTREQEKAEWKQERKDCFQEATDMIEQSKNCHEEFRQCVLQYMKEYPDGSGGEKHDRKHDRGGGAPCTCRGPYAEGKPTYLNDPNWPTTCTPGRNGNCKGLTVCSPCMEGTAECTVCGSNADCEKTFTQCPQTQ